MKTLVSFLCALLCLCVVSEVHAQQDPSYSLVRSFITARRLRAHDRLSLLQNLAASPKRAVANLGLVAPQDLLPKEELKDTRWIAVIDNTGKLLAKSGEVPADIYKRPVVQKALGAFSRDDLIRGIDGPLYVGAVPIGHDGVVRGVLLAAWPEGEGVEKLAAESCGCTAMLMFGSLLIAGDPQYTKNLVKFIELEKKRTENIDPSSQMAQSAPSSMPSNEEIVFTSFPGASELKATMVHVPGELPDVSYVLLFSKAQYRGAVPMQMPDKPFEFPLLLLSAASMLTAFFIFSRLFAQRLTKPNTSLTPQKLSALFREFVTARIRCNESIEGINEQIFIGKIKELYKHFSATHKQNQIRFGIVIRNGRTFISAMPDKE